MQDKGLKNICNDLQMLSSLRKLDISFNPFKKLENLEQFPKLAILSAYSCLLNDVDRLDEYVCL